MLVHFLLRTINLSKLPVLFPIIAMVKLAEKWVLLNLTHIEEQKDFELIFYDNNLRFSFSISFYNKQHKLDKIYGAFGKVDLGHSLSKPESCEPLCQLQVFTVKTKSNIKTGKLTISSLHRLQQLGKCRFNSFGTIVMMQPTMALCLVVTIPLWPYYYNIETGD